MADREWDSAPVTVRPRTVTMTGVLLVIEWFGFLVLGVLHMAARLDRYRLPRETAGIIRMLDIDGDHARLLSVIFLSLALGALIAAAGFFRVWYLAWLLATSTQGVALLTVIVLYFSSGPAFGYPVMVFCVILVSYLNYPDVAETFHSRETGFCKKVAK